MQNDREEQLRQKAYKIWEDEGRPEGRHHDHWTQAETQGEEESSEEDGATGSQSAGQGSVEAEKSSEKRSSVTITDRADNASPGAAQQQRNQFKR
jgi:hypothetical protein